jgi:hypothetical protein
MMKKIILVVGIALMVSFYGYAQREGVTRRWTIEELTAEAKKLNWNSEDEVCFWGEYRKMTYTTLDSIHANNVIFEKSFCTCIEAKKDFKRLRDKMLLLPWASEFWVVDKWTIVIYFENYGVYLRREDTEVEIQFLPFFGD